MLNKKEQLLKHFLYNATAHWLWKPMALKSNFTSEFFLQSCGLPATFRKGLGKNDLYNRRKYSPIAFNINTKTSSAKIVCLKSRNFESYSLFKNVFTCTWILRLLRWYSISLPCHQINLVCQILEAIFFYSLFSCLGFYSEIYVNSYEHYTNGL